MKIIPYNSLPYESAFDNFVKSFFDDSLWTARRPAVEAKSTEDGGYTLSYKLAGYKPQDLKVEVEDNILKISAKNDKMGAFSYSVSVPDYIDAAKIDAKLEHGLLEVSLPAKEEKKPKRIEIAIK